MQINFSVWYQVVDICMKASNPFDYLAFSLEIHKCFFDGIKLIKEQSSVW